MKFREILKSKINNAVVTEKSLEYRGSIGIDNSILERVNILPGEKVQVLNYNNGSRIETYVIAEKENSRKIVLYGPAARCGEVGDKVCILSYFYVSEDEVKEVKPLVIELSDDNILK